MSTTRNKLQKILALVCDIDDVADDKTSVWGFDTDCGSKKELLDQAERIWNDDSSNPK